MENEIDSRSIQKLAIKSFENNKIRNILLVIAIALTTILYTSLFTISFSIIHFIEKESRVPFLDMNNRVIIFNIVIAITFVLITGYLIIYNIFNISLVKDIHFYGLLRTIGMTVEQIRSMLYKQMIILCIIGIPIGILFGISLEKFTLQILSKSIDNNESISILMNISIVIFAILFSIITVFISILKPTIHISTISPIECNKYSTWNSSSLEKTKHTTNGGKIYRMAWCNLKREGNRTSLIILSISLSLILFNSTVNLTEGFDTSLYLKSVINTDFVIGNKCYFDWNKSYWKEEGALSENFVDNIKQSKFFKEGGCLYYNVYTWDCTLKADMIPEKSGTWGFYFQRDLEGNCYSELYGLEDFPISKLEIIDGTLDMEKLRSGKYIIAGVECDKYGGGNASKDADYFKIGDKVTVIINGIEHEYEILAKCCIRNGNSVRYESDTFGLKMYLPASEYKKIIVNPVMISYEFNVQNGEINKAEDFIKNYIKNNETSMGYESKQTYTDYLKGLESIITIGGGTISLIIGIIGIINFVNSMIASVISRKLEFAMLECIGMTRKQLVTMLSFEGMYYSFIATIMSLVLGSAISYFLIKNMENITWCFKYTFTIEPIMISSIVIITFSLIVPYIIFISNNRQMLVNRMRENF